MKSFLTQILEAKHEEVKRLKKTRSLFHKNDRAFPIRDFGAAISVPHSVSLIAEIKFASPSAGMIREYTDPLLIGKIYAKAGAAAISFLTDHKFFGGDLSLLPALKKAVSLPILRKDFIIDEVQVEQSFLSGADAVLLIARILTRPQLERLLISVGELGMSALVEVHDQDDLHKAVAGGADIIGINNRNLKTFEVDLETSLKLVPLVPDYCIAVSESGIERETDIQRLMKCGIKAVLVGTSIMKSDNMAQQTRRFVRAGGIQDDQS